ncbi:MAG: hypothetical protein JXR78_17370 [Victivallales bacterium]|nr:hypothetical protein [Victivallales bacterium]
MSNSSVVYGTGRRCINPKVPSNLAGYFNIRMWDNVLDDIYVHALVIKQNGVASAIVYFDLLNINSKLSDRIYELVEKTKILSKENVIICASHTHTAPAINEDWSSNPEYYFFVVTKAIEAITDACLSMHAGELCFGGTSLEGLAFNRRYWMKNGTVVTNPGKMNPDIEKTEGPVDCSIPMMGIKQNGKLKVLIANISNHGDTIGGTAISSDWMGICRSMLEDEMGSGSMFFPLIAPSGNINHFDVTTPKKQYSYDEATRIGKTYAYAISEAIKDLKNEDVSLSVANNIVRVKPREVDNVELEEAKKVVEKYSKLNVNDSGTDVTAEDFANNSPVVLKLFADAVIKRAQDNVEREFNLVCIDFGPLCIISLPSEIFVEIGIEIRTNIFPEKVVMIATHSSTGARHVSNGYVPNEFNFGRGGYETSYRAAPYEIATSNKLVDGIRVLKSRLK